jgi:hypothetical protein
MLGNPNTRCRTEGVHLQMRSSRPPYTGWAGRSAQWEVEGWPRRLRPERHRIPMPLLNLKKKTPMQSARRARVPAGPSFRKPWLHRDIRREPRSASEMGELDGIPDEKNSIPRWLRVSRASLCAGHLPGTS